MLNPNQKDFAPSSQTVDWYIEQARTMQAEYIARGARRAFRAVGQVFSTPGGTPELRR